MERNLKDKRLNKLELSITTGLAIRAFVGIGIGTATDNLALWLALGIGFGIALGAGLGGLLGR